MKKYKLKLVPPGKYFYIRAKSQDQAIKKLEKAAVKYSGPGCAVTECVEVKGNEKL